MQLSQNFSLSEFTASDKAKQYGISNEPTPEALTCLKTLVTMFLQPLRTKLNKPIKISSGYRNDKVNRLVGGVDNSQHELGEAVDISVDGMTPKQLCEFIIQSGLEFDQIICEPTWVHCSYSKGKNRKQVLTAKRKPDGKMQYFAGLVV